MEPLSHAAGRKLQCGVEAQDRVSLERHVRQANGTWLTSFFEDLKAIFDFSSVPARIPLAEVYRGVTSPQSPTSQASCLWKRSELRTIMAMAMDQRTAAWTQSSAQPAPRRMTPRDASMSQVVGMAWETYQKKRGMES